MKLSAKDARVLLTAKTWKIKLEPVQKIIDQIVISKLNAIENDIRRSISAGLGKYVIYYSEYERSQTAMIKSHFQNYIMSNDQFKQTYKIIYDRVFYAIQHNGYTVNIIKIKNLDEIHIIWSSGWNHIISHLIIRKLIKKYISQCRENWLLPPNGRIYLKAMENFNNNLK